MYLLSLRLAPSPWVGSRCPPTDKYTVPSVSSQTVTPRRVGFLACASAPPRAEPAGPSVWWTMMLRQGWAFDTSPHGARQTIFSPGIWGVPEARAIAARSGVSADAGARIATTQNAVTNGLKFMGRYVARSRVLAQGQFRHRFAIDCGRQRRCRVIDGMAVLAVILGSVKRMVGGGHQPVRERADLPGPLRDADRERDRNIRADAALGVLAAHFQHAAGDHRALAQRRGGQQDAELLAAGARQHVAGP